MSRDYVGIAHGYLEDVLAGRIPASQWVKLACERQRRDLEQAARQGFSFLWSDAAAVDICRFAESMPHVEGKWGTPTIRLEPWQCFILCSLFGWRHRADLSRRRFTALYLEVGRKAAKSTLMAVIALYHLLHEHEPGASVICGATTGQQARIVFSIMQRMIRKSPELRAAGLQVFANAITYDAIDGSARPINAKASSQDGLNPSCIVLDESHAQDFALHDVLKSAQGARHNPLILAPTTAGYDLLSVGYALRTTLTKVLQNIFENDALLGLIYTLDPTDDWRDPAVWIKSNPSIGTTPTLEWVTSYCRDAQQTPGLEGEFRVKVCSEWLQSSQSWLSMAAWDACADATLKLEDFFGEPCWIGVDLGQVDDLTACALLFKRDDILYGFVRHYLPELVVNDRARRVPAYRTWAETPGILTTTPGNMVDFGIVEQDLRADCDRFQVQEIVLDQFGSMQLASSLSNDGIPARIEAKNPKNQTPPARELEARVTHRKFRHDGNQCLRWQASNCVVSRRSDDSLLVKKEEAESPSKIDAIDALLQAIGSMLAQPAPVVFTGEIQFV